MKYQFIFSILLISLGILSAQEEIDSNSKSGLKSNKPKKKKPVIKQRLQCNMTIKYKKRPKKVDSFEELFTKGIFYGRLRSNNFLYDTVRDNKDHYVIGIGGSLIYKSAKYKNFSFTTGLYASQTLNNISIDKLADYKAGKDIFSRYVMATKGRKNIFSFAQNYLSYKKNRTEIKIGRFLIETLLLKSNDSKMIPNTFEGINLQIRTIPKTQIQLAYIRKQKLRNHESFHRVLAYNDNNLEAYSNWSQNDDGAMHRGISVSKLDEKGIDDHIFLFEIKNQSLKNTTVKANYTIVPQLLSSLVLESTYRFKIKNKLTIKPSIHYMKQFDNGAGKIAGANLRTDSIGYDNPNSLSNTLLASRIDFIYGPASLRFGYSKVYEGGDIISPWRAQPTSGYSRAMSQMNWYANTETTMIRADFDFQRANLINGLHIMSRYARENFDDTKPGVTADLNIFTFDIIKRFKEYPNFMIKLRTGFIHEDHKVANLDGSLKKNPSYNDIRVEMNYLF